MDPLTIAAIGWLMSTLVNKAVTALLEAWAKRIDLGNEFKTLNDQLLQLSVLLTSARGLRTNNRFLEELVQNLQQLAYRSENLLDELDYYRLEDEIHQTGTHESVNCSSKSSVASSSSSGFRLASRSAFSTLEGQLPKTFSSRLNLPQRMNKLAEQLQKSKKEVRKALKTEALVITSQNTEISQTEVTNLRQTSSFLTEPIVFGRNQERDQLMNLLTNEESVIVGKVPVLAIVGSGGVGKTTLARLVFNDPKIHSYFEVKLWICVSTRFDIDRLTRDMLECVCGNRYDKLTILDTLQNKLKDELASKRFLLVLDDMWEENESQWDLMVAPLNCCMLKGSIILVTTRKKSIVKMVNSREIYLQGLGKDAFLSFFSTCIFNDPNFGGNQRLRTIGQQIANKLKGNPLAAKTVSALLKKKLDVRYWIEIRDSEEWKSQSGPNDIMPALRLSYEQMPFHLQRCFSYCVIFPKDHPFTYKRLIYLWMSQGFLDVRSEGKRMEDIGSAYFNDLFDRGFFQTIQSTYGDKVHYTFHDLIHDLAHIIAFKECLTISGPEPRQIPPTIRHLSIFHGMQEAELEDAIVRVLPFLEGENISTIISWDAFTSSIFQNNSDLLKKTKFLRALRLNLWSPVQPHNFVSLRYLVLLIPNNCMTLPTEICRLYHLQVLEIANGQLLDELPNNFSDLVSLRHFIVIGRSLHSKIRHVGKLTSLQKLKQFDVQQKIGFEIEQLGSLKDIRGSLHIRNLENVKSKAEASKARLAEKEKLDALYLNWRYGEQENKNVLEGLKPNTNLKLLDINGYGGVASPTWLEPSLMFLESLALINCKAWELLPPIGELKFLKDLTLCKLAVREIGPQCYGTHQSIKFPSLQELKIIRMPYLEKWMWNDQIQLFPCLKILRIDGCEKLVDFPLSGCATSEVLERFPSLERLVIFECPLIFRPPPLPCSSLLSFISIENSVVNLESMVYERTKQKLILMLDQSSSLKVDELLPFHEFSSLRSLVISNISSLVSLDLHSCVALENLVIKGCQSLTSLTFGEHLVCLKILKIISCKTLNSMKGLKSWINLERLLFRKCSGFIAAWDSELKEIERTEPEFSLSLRTIVCDSLALLTLPICMKLTSLQYFRLEVSTFTEKHEVS